MNYNSKIFVAGHRGLVGSAILNNLVARGHTNLVTRTRQELDLLNQEAVGKFFELEKPEYVFLAAAKVGGIVANNTYRADFIYENLQVQNNVVHHSYLNGVKKLLFLGSTCVYPRDTPQPIVEDSLLTSPLEYTNEPYAIAKIAGIKLCESYNIQYGTNCLSVMPTNLYGHNDNFDLETAHVLPALMRKIYLAKLLSEDRLEEVLEDLNLDTLEEAEKYLNGFGVSAEKVEIWGTGRPMREFMWSEDLADACVYIMENVNFDDLKLDMLTSDTVEIRNTHINIGTGEEISIKELAFTIKEIVGFNGDFYFNSSKPDGTMKKLTEVSKLHSLGWKHTVELKDGIDQLYKYYVDMPGR